ncbi:serine/threonine protein phosphatase [Listeria grandensis FSL F6-0971]|uniref:Serine/threonine protein phosphatase n=1 Tax=Listeria grandensis FSL F6-0971 TaxID=1265819 RepID=W7AY11_9LIST|nr:metallophosphoesterase [Listeria grandensis]EUJ18507.1 serine/threonine protein phosphatase [Listeria grandensis FSL F6-0971]
MKKAALACIALLVLALTGCTQPTEPSSEPNISPKIPTNQPLTIYQATDIHYLSNTLTDGKQAFKTYLATGDGKQQNYITEITDAFVDDVKAQKPDVLVLSGDITNNGEKVSHEEMAEKLDEIEKSGVQTFVIPGNHDILNPYARKFEGDQQVKAESITPKEFASIYHNSGYDEAVMRDDTTLSYLVAPSSDVWLLMVDTSEYENNKRFGAPETNGYISTQTFEWIQKCIDLAKKHDAKLITVTHHNLLDHSELLNKGFTIVQNKAAVSLFAKNDIPLNLSGHVHIQDIRSDTRHGKTIYDVATSSMAMYPQQYGVINYAPNQGLSYKTQRVDVEKYAQKINSKDPNLLDFQQYSKDYFGKFGYTKALGELLLKGKYDVDDADKMAKTMEQANFAYFTGDKSYLQGIEKMPGYALWQAADGEFLTKYIDDIVKNKAKNDLTLEIHES